MSHHHKCGACGTPLTRFAGVELHRPLKLADESSARCVADGEWWPCVPARLAHIREDQQRSLNGDLPEDQEMRLGRGRNRWVEDEVRLLVLLVQEVAVERDGLLKALAAHHHGYPGFAGPVCGTCGFTIRAKEATGADGS